jgi:cytidine deaminase
MTHARLQLIEEARSVVGRFDLKNDFSAGAVGAAIRTIDGNIYKGICIDIACGLGFCAEIAAISQMLTHRETRIESVVAVKENGIIYPCGRCRDTMAQIDVRNLDCQVIVSEDLDVALRDLLPNFWLTKW